MFDGFQVMTMEQAAPLGDIFITVTGCCDVINKTHYALMKNGAILSNAGHFDLEVNVIDLRNLSVQPPYEARKHITAYTMSDGRKINLIGEGRLVNLAAGDGHPSEIMDLSFAMQILSMLYLLENKNKLGNNVHILPEEQPHKYVS